MRFLLALLFLALSWGQADASTRIYLVPVVTTVDGVRVPKYIGDGTVLKPKYSALYYGAENWVLVGADLSVADDALVVATADGFALPRDLDQTLTAGQASAVQARLETAKIPAHWVSASLTWRQVLRTTIGMSLILQRLTAVNTTNFFSVAVLDSAVSTLPVQVRTDLLAVATSLGLDTSSISGSTTIRQALRICGEQLRDSNREFLFNGIGF